MAVDANYIVFLDGTSFSNIKHFQKEVISNNTPLSSHLLDRDLVPARDNVSLPGKVGMASRTEKFIEDSL